ncbi:hypothetical protein TNCV_3214771 [Trichonephila clavipes]|nr:hypothetical protein TNCV_3214771 [Trichonephila clavipes]
MKELPRKLQYDWSRPINAESGRGKQNNGVVIRAEIAKNSDTMIGGDVFEHRQVDNASEPLARLEVCGSLRCDQFQAPKVAN